MPRGVRNSDFSEQEKMDIARRYDDNGGGVRGLRAAKAFIRNELDGQRNPNPRRDLKPCLRNDSLLKKWQTKLNVGIAPHDDRRR